MSRLNKFLDLCKQADSLKLNNRHEEVADISNQVARNIMGWHTDPMDPKRLWRDQAGFPITVPCWDRSVLICEHPWVEGRNSLDEVSFSPGHNYHRNWHDWRDWVVQELSKSKS